MVALDRYRGAAVLVLGYGRTGRATAAALSAGGADVSVWDDLPAMRQEAAEDGYRISEEADGEPDLVAASPGVPSNGASAHPRIRAARRAGARVDNDVGLFFEWLRDRSSPAPAVIGVTGTNGKSTTTALIAHILNENGVPACAAANIGLPVLALDGALLWRALALELSSFQLEAAGLLAPDIAVLLNVADDHLDRHGTFERYRAAKLRLFDTDGGRRHFVIGVEDESGRSLAEEVRTRTTADAGFPEVSMDVFGETALVAGYPSGIAVGDDSVARFAPEGRLGEFAPCDAPALPGAHNLRNVAAAILATARLVADADGIRAALRSFSGLPHRIERLGTVSGVAFVNDSKATNPESAARALAAFRRIRWIAGGRLKPGGLDPVFPVLSNVRHAYLIGEGAREIADALGTRVPHSRCGDLASAVSRAARESETGDTVLLSPACASYDQFASFEHRGDAFRSMYEALAEEYGSTSGLSSGESGNVPQRTVSTPPSTKMP